MLALAGLLIASVSLAGAAEAPRVRVSETEPLTVRGSHFRPGERVKIVVRSGGSRSETSQRASADGSFSALLPALKFDECRGYVVKAEGSQGSRASHKLRGAECASPPEDVGPGAGPEKSR